MIKKKVAIFSPKQAIKDYNKKLLGFTDIASRVRTPEDKLMAQQMQMQQAQSVGQQPSLDAYLMTMGKPSSPASKMAIAKEIGYSNYTGTPENDNVLLQALQGQSINNQNQQMADKEEKVMQSESEFKNREFGLKDREMALREKEVENNMPPSPEEIANQLLSKIK